MFKPGIMIKYFVKLRETISVAKAPLFEVGVDILRYFVTRPKGKKKNGDGRETTNTSEDI